ncbi:MAG: PD-(D/E)XK nuclease family protein [Candidatus Paceibacterota bacterium]|jgi:hypothetical protein
MAKADKLVESTIEFTQSRMNSFLTCPRKEFFEYRCQGCGVRPKRTETYFLEGEFGHYALKHWYTSKLMLRANLIKRVDASLKALGDMEPEVYEDYQRRMSAMIGACHAYKAHYTKDHDAFNIIGVEQPFEVVIGKFKFRGRLDLLLEDKKDKTIGFMEHKFMSQFSNELYASLPLNLQQLLYSLGFEAITGKKPNWYRWNVIKKSQLRRKGMKPTKEQRFPHPESLIEFESRVQNQYMEEPDDMFFRPAPRKVERAALDAVQDSVLNWMEVWEAMVAKGTLPPMCFTSCDGKYNNPCTYGPACIAAMTKGGEGWNAPECQGMYVKKTVLHPELEEKDDKEDKPAKPASK